MVSVSESPILMRQRRETVLLLVRALSRFYLWANVIERVCV